MLHFTLCNPTEIRFGGGQIVALGEVVPQAARVLLLYGGGGIKSNGVYDQVRAALGNRQVEEFGGVEVNPHYETLQAAAASGRAAGCDFVLGVGGGSVIDAAKFLACLLAVPEADPWDRLAAGQDDVVPPPVGAVLTLPATGSESNPVSVISSTARQLKIPFRNDRARPRFAIMNPSTMRTLSRRQLENGVVDAFTHVLACARDERKRSGVQHRWHLDLVFVKINGETHYLWLAGDHEGEVFENFVTRMRDRSAAPKFLKKLMKRHGRPGVIVTDGLRSDGRP